MPQAPEPFRDRAFTLAELLIALLIISMIGVAVASLGEAVFKGWTATEDEANLERSVHGTVNQVETLLRSAKWIGTAYNDADLSSATNASVTGVTAIIPGALTPGSGAACMFWTGESSTTMMLIKDVKIIEHNTIDDTLVLWSIPPEAPNANVPLNVADISMPIKVMLFKLLPNVNKSTIATGVAECKFTGWAVNSSPNIRTVEASITFQRGECVRRWHGTLSPIPIAMSETTLLN